MSRAVDSLVAAVLPTWPVLDPGARERLLPEIAGFVRTEIALAPFHVRIGVRVLTFAFFLLARIVATGRGFSSRPAEWQAWYMAFWGGLSPQTQAMVRVYRSLSVLAFYESAPVLAALEVEAREDQVARFRQRRDEALAGGAA